MAKILGIFSGRRVFGGNFQAPHKQRFGFCESSLFLYATMILTTATTLLRHLERAQKRKTNLRSQDLKIAGKKTSKYKKINTYKKDPDDLCHLTLIEVT